MYDLEKGNLLVVGSTGSGRTTLIQTIVLSLVRSCPPDMLVFHIIDFAGHKLRLPSRISTFWRIYEPADSDRIHKLLSFLKGTLEERRRLFLEARSLNLASYNRSCVEETVLPTVLVVIKQL